MEVVGEGTDGVQHALRIPTSFVLNAFTFDGALAKQVVNIDGKFSGHAANIRPHELTENRGNEFALHGATPSRTAAIRHEVAEYEVVAFDDLPQRYTYRPPKNRPVEHERVKLAVLTAWIHPRWKIRQKSLIE